MIITICSSAHFYKQVVDIQEKLEQSGHTALIPATAHKMKESGDFEVEHYKTWFGNADDYYKKSELMRKHFTEIEKGDAVLVVNFNKHGKKNYIGPNVLMEMGLAFWLNKPIYIYNNIPDDSPFEEEIKGFQATVLQGELGLIPTE